MFTIRKATVADCELIHKMAKEVFPATYKEILSPEQLDYMMDWMYAPSNVRKQMEEEGHVYSIFRRYMSSPVFRVRIAAVFYSRKQSSVSRRYTRDLV